MADLRTAADGSNRHELYFMCDDLNLHSQLKYFSFIDWIGGTLYVPQGTETLDFGLYEDADHEPNSVWNFYCLPFKRAFGGLLRPSAPLPETSGSGTAQSGY